MKGLQPSGIRRRNKMIYAAVVLFLKNGYEKTTTAQIARRAGMSATSFFAAFPNKEAILYALVREMLAEQFKWTERLLGERPDPLLLYCAETALQIHITELSPELRELYMTAYSLQSTSEYIYQNISKKLETFFAPYLPGAQASDFYELEIASAGVMRGFMGRPCDLYFTIELSSAAFSAAACGCTACRRRSRSRSSRGCCRWICAHRHRRSSARRCAARRRGLKQ